MTDLMRHRNGPLIPGETVQARAARLSADRRAARRAARTLVDGHLVSDLLAPWMHGTPTGYQAWYCRCAPCRAAQAAVKRPARVRARNRTTTPQETP